VEQSNDENGFWLPTSIAPFEILVSATNTKDEAIKNAAEILQSGWKPPDLM